MIPTCVLASISAARQKHLPRETGGFLIGQRRGDHLETLTCTHQSDGDQSTTTSFTRLSKKHAEAVEKAWRTSEGSQSLIGDWHSHPKGDAIPSSTDKRAWTTLAKAMNAPGIGVIAAENGVRVFFFCIRHWRLVVTECVAIEENTDETAYRIDA